VKTSWSESIPSSRLAASWPANSSAAALGPRTAFSRARDSSGVGAWIGQKVVLGTGCRDQRPDLPPPPLFGWCRAGVDTGGQRSQGWESRTVLEWQLRFLRSVNAAGRCAITGRTLRVGSSWAAVGRGRGVGDKPVGFGLGGSRLLRSGPSTPERWWLAPTRPAGVRVVVRGVEFGRSS
jgi:hypothetical protein